MPSYSSPGVYVNEAALSTLVPSTGGAGAAAFWGTASRGPTTVTAVSDWGSYKSLFGDLEDPYDLGYAVYHYFANGGRLAYVTRVIGTGAATALTETPLQWFPGEDGVAGSSEDFMTITARSPGTWGNGITVQVVPGDRAASSTQFPTFTLVVALDGVEVERWVEVSPTPSDNRYVESVVNRYSSFITVSDVNPDNAPFHAEAAFFTTSIALEDGTAGATVADTDFTTAINSIDAIKGNLILNAVGQTSATIASALIAKASSRGDSFVILDPNKTDSTLAEIQATAAAYSTASASGYAAAYAPALEMVDPAKTGVGAIRTTYPGGAVAGLYVRTEVERNVAKTPAGFSSDVRGAITTTVKLTEANVGALYNGAPPVNTFRAQAGAGVYVNGGRTLNKLNPDKFISVRRTLNYLKTSLKDLTEFAVFEPNDIGLWTELNVKIAGFLSEFWRSGGLKGATSNQAFYIVCDGSNNTPSSIDQGEVHVDVGVALQYPAEFIIINLSQWSGGSNATES